MEFAVHFFSSCFIALPRKAGLAALWDACWWLSFGRSSWSSTSLPALPGPIRSDKRRHQPSLLAAMVRVLLNNVVLAESDAPVILEGNFYFPPDTVHKTKLSSSNTS